MEYSDTDDVARKQDVHADTGQSTAYFDGRIYYISQEDGEDGIYSMLEDGSDVHFELSVPKITRMIVTQDYIYYVGAKSPEEYEGQKVFSLYQFDRSTFETIEVEYSDSIQSVYDAYVTDGGVVCVLVKRGPRGMVPPSNFAYIKNSSEFLKADISLNGHLESNDEVIFAHDELNAFGKSNLVGDYNVSFLDANSGVAVMNSVELNAVPYFKVLYAEGDKIWCSLDNNLLEIDRKTLQVSFIYMNFDDKVHDMKITEMYMHDDAAFVIYEKQLGGTQLFYRLDLEYAAYNELMTFNKGKVLLKVEDEYVLWAKGNKIFSSQYIDERYRWIIGEPKLEIEMPENIVANNILEIAGDWLFIHKKASSADTETNQLLYKVNLVTKEIQKVD